MPDTETPFPPFWINDRDHHGRPLEPSVIQAARSVWGRACRSVSQLLRDPGRAPEIIEMVAAAVSRRLRRTGLDPIRDVESYLYWACVRRAERIVVRESREQTGHETAALESLAANTAGQKKVDPADKLYVKEILSLVDSPTRELFLMRAAGYPWGEIAKMRGYANAHSAEVQFGKKWKAAMARIARRSKRAAGAFERQG